MNVPKSKKQRYRERKRKQRLVQNELFGRGYKGPLTKTPFWVDIDVHGNKLTQNMPTEETTSEFIGMNTSIQHELDLTDDNSPSIPLAQTITQTQGTPHALKKPLLNIQGKTQEKFKVNQKQNVMQNEKQEQSKTDNQNKEQNAQLNEENIKMESEMKSIEQNKSVHTKQPDLNESTFKNIQQKSDVNNTINKDVKTFNVSDQTTINRSNPTPVQSVGTEIKNKNNTTISQPKTKLTLNKLDAKNTTNKESTVSAMSDQAVKNRSNPTPAPSLGTESKSKNSPTIHSKEREIKNINIATFSQSKTIPTLNRPANEGNSGSQIPVLLKQPVPHMKIKDTVKTIPTLTNQGKLNRVLVATTNVSANYQNVYNVVHPPPVNTQADLQQQYFYAQESIPPRTAMPSGVPMSFLMQQQNFGAIQPQQIPGYMPNNPVPMAHVMPIQTNQPTFSQQQIHNMHTESSFAPNTTTYVSNEVPAFPSRPYSPSDLFTEDGEANKANEEEREDSSSPDICKAGQRRLSAFKRLGPLTQPKKPKLTINLSFNKEQAVREVVGENDATVPKYIPVHMRQDILKSTDDIVTTFLDSWPWKNRIVVRKSVGARVSKSAMMMEQEQMEEVYERGNIFIQLSVKGYPNTWSKEDVLDTLLENLKGKTFVPCFIEFTPNECKFLVLRSRPALVAIHKLGFTARKDDVVLHITIFDIDLDIKTINFVPKTVLRLRVMKCLEAETKLNLAAFTLQPDVSHFIYYPLNRTSNQIGIVDLNVSIAWKNLTHLVLSHNRITTIEGFDLQHTTPVLQDLDISHNYIERITVLLNCRKLPLKSLKLEGNPLCTDYRDPHDYVKVARMLFPMLREIDGIAIEIKGDIPTTRRNFCDAEAKGLVEKFVQTYFPILEAPSLGRELIKDMYDSNAILSVTYRPSLLNMSIYRKNRILFVFNRKVGEYVGGCASYSKNIVKWIKKWPNLEHDLTTFTVDVMSHTDSSTLVCIGGILKITSDSLAEDEPMLAFTKTILLHTTEGVEYKIRNDMLYWDLPTQEYIKHAFRQTVPKRTLSVAFDTAPDKDTKDYIVNIFMKLTELDRPQSERYLEEKDWNIKDALQFFTELVKLNSVTQYVTQYTICLQVNW